MELFLKILNAIKVTTLEYSYRTEINCKPNSIKWIQNWHEVTITHFYHSIINIHHNSCIPITIIILDQRFLIWQRNKCLRQIDQLYKGVSNEYSSYSKYSESKAKPPVIVFNKIKKSSKFQTLQQ